MSPFAVIYEPIIRCRRQSSTKGKKEEEEEEEKGTNGSERLYKYIQLKGAQGEQGAERYEKVFDSREALEYTQTTCNNSS